MGPATPLEHRTFAEFVKAIVANLNRSRITYAVTGALAASYYGVPRTTVDADFKVKISAQKLPELWKTLEQSGLEVDRNRASRRLRSGYNIVSFEDSLSGHTADFIIETRKKIERRKGTLLGLQAFYDSPESLIVAKLRMIKATIPKERAEKDREDVRAIMAQTRVSMHKIIARSERQDTDEIFQELFGKRKFRNLQRVKNDLRESWG